MSKVIYFCVIVLFDVCYCWITDINYDMLARSSRAQQNERKITLNLLVPGTKWCGAGNIANGTDDLGTEKELDMCCRDHDLCPDLIPGGATNHGLTNTAFYTRLHCDCDNQFHKCLKAVDTTSAKAVGRIYFDGLLTKCYRKDYPVTGCVKNTGWFNLKCAEYSYDTSGEQIYQWFDVKSFDDDPSRFLPFGPDYFIDTNDIDF